MRFLLHTLVQLMVVTSTTSMVSASMATDLYALEAKSDVYDIKFPEVGQIYELPAERALFHGTDGKFDGFKADEPIWFSARYEQSGAHAMRMFRINNLGDWGGGIGETELKDGALNNEKLKAGTIYVKNCVTKTKLNLLYLNYNDALNLKALTVATGGMYNRPGVVGESSDNTKPIIKGSGLCTKYDGWRNPYDQDEIMICPSKVKDIHCATTESFKTLALWSACGVYQPAKYVKAEVAKQQFVGEVVKPKKATCELNRAFFANLQKNKPGGCCIVQLETEAQTETNSNIKNNKLKHRTLQRKLWSNNVLTPAY